MDNEVDEFYDYLVSVGALKVDGDDVSIDPELMAIYCPELMAAVQDEVDETIFSLSDKGLVEIYVDDQGDFVFAVTPVALAIMENSSL